MILILILFLLLTIKLCFYQFNPLLKLNKKYKLKVLKRPLFTQKINLNFKFLTKEKLTQKQLILLDNILLKLTVNAPKKYDLADNLNLPIFIHNYSKKIIIKAKKYINFTDININKLSKEKLKLLQDKNVNYKVEPWLKLPKNKISFFEDFKISQFDFKTYSLSIYKNNKIEIAHYNFGEYDYLKFIPFSKQTINFVYYQPLQTFKNKLMIVKQNLAHTTLSIPCKTKFFMYSYQPSYFHYSKNQSQFSKQNCLIALYNLELEKSFEICFCFSNQYKKLLTLDELINNTKKSDVFALKNLLIK